MKGAGSSRRQQARRATESVACRRAEVVPLSPINCCPRLSRCSVCETHDPTGEPSAGNPPAGFGERRLETGPRRGVRHRHCESRREQLPPPPTVTAPVADSTPFGVLADSGGKWTVLRLTSAITRTVQGFVLHIGVKNGLRSTESPTGTIFVFRTPASDKSVNSVNAAALTCPVCLVDVVILFEGLFAYLSQLVFKPIHYFPLFSATPAGQYESNDKPYPSHRFSTDHVSMSVPPVSESVNAVSMKTPLTVPINGLSPVQPPNEFLAFTHPHTISEAWESSRAPAIIRPKMAESGSFKALRTP